MHWNVEQILWALIMAGHLVLLVVLLGRDRASRFPWFTASIVVSAVCLLANHLLREKLTSVAFYWQSYIGLALQSILAICVLVELARHIFSSCRAGLILNYKGWIGWTLVTVPIAVAALWAWGPWPVWKELNSDPEQLPLLLTVLSAMKAQLIASLFTVEIALLILIFARRFGFGWKSHAQQISLGLSTIAFGFLIVQGITDYIKRTVHLTSRDQYDGIVRLFTNLDNARFALWFLVLVWWTAWLWRDEPGVPAQIIPATPIPTSAISASDMQTAVPEILPPLEPSIPESEQEGDPDFRD